MDNTNHEETQRAYWAKDIADLLEISTSNLRRWSIDLESAGYRFYRDEHNRRAYFEKDIMPLRKLKEFLANNMSKNDAIKAVISMFPQDENGVITIPVNNEEYSELLEEFKAFREQQQNFNQELIQQLNKQQEYISNKLEERDKTLMIALKESMETQKLLASSKQKSWWKFWEK